MNFYVNFVQHQKKCAIYIYGSLIAEIFVAIFTYFFFKFSWSITYVISFICYTIPHYMIIGVVFQFICATIGCRDRIILITTRMSLKFRLSSFEILNYIYLYKNLCEISKDIQKFLTMQLLPVFAFLFINLTFHLYYIVRSMFKNLEEFKIYAIGGSLWSLLLMFPIFIVIQTSEKFLDSFENLQEVGYEILYGQRILDPASKEAFSHFMRSIKVSKFKMQTIFFEFDWKLIFKVSDKWLILNYFYY